MSELKRVFSQAKMNSDAFYDKEGTMPKSKMLVDMHPDVSEVVWKFNRWHHHVNYKPFKKTKLIRKEDVDFPNVVNNFGMILKHL